MAIGCDIASLITATWWKKPSTSAQTASMPHMIMRVQASMRLAAVEHRGVM